MSVLFLIMTSIMFHPEKIISAQLPDRILINGVWSDLFTNPLEQYWTSRKKKRPSFFTRYNCTRGYVAKWDIQNNELLLLSVDGYCYKRNFLLRKKKVPCSIKMIFPRANYNPVKATWFSGKLRIPQGKMTQYEHHNYDSRFEQEIIVTVDKGNILKSVTLNFKEKTLAINYESLV